MGGGAAGGVQAALDTLRLCAWKRAEVFAQGPQLITRVLPLLCLGNCGDQLPPKTLSYTNALAAFLLIIILLSFFPPNTGADT